MALLVSYIVKSFLASGILYFYYRLVLRNKTFHSYNRFYLLISVLFSLIIPFIHFNNFPLAVIPQSSIASGSIINQGLSIALLGCFGSVSVFLLVIMISKIAWICKVRRNGSIKKMDGIVFIETTVKQAPFSFFNNLFWRQGLSHTDENGTRILTHELTHIRQQHSYDKIVTQLVLCICWINPFYWLFYRELNTVHEFLADAAAIEQGDSASFAGMLLQSYHSGSYLDSSHQFFHSSIQRRLKMISSPAVKTYAGIRKLATIPVVIGVFVLLTAPMITGSSNLLAEKINKDKLQSDYMDKEVRLSAHLSEQELVKKKLGLERQLEDIKR